MWILTVAAVIYAGCCAFLYFAQRSFIYFPVPETGGIAAEDLRLEIGGASIQVWRLHGPAEDAIIYFGGNAEDVSQNVPQFAQWFPDKAVYLVNYRGYGASTGSPSEVTLVADAKALFDHVAREHAGITLIGRSLGSGVAMQLAAARQPARLVLVTPFDSIAGLAQSAFPVFPVRQLLRDRFDSIGHAEGIAVPVLMLIAEHDEIIPAASSERLAEALDASLLTVRVVGNAMHNTIHMSDDYAAALRAFLR